MLRPEGGWKSSETNSVVMMLDPTSGFRREADTNRPSVSAAGERGILPYRASGDQLPSVSEKPG